MTHTPLTPRPRVSVLVRATAIGTLTLSPLACGDDGSTTSVADSDVHPTAGPCAHDPQLPECGSTGAPPVTTGTTSATSVADSTTGTGGSSDSGGGTSSSGSGSGSGTGTSTGSTGAG